ncbi:coagulation factor XI-like [Ctenocephalides felis]|uniref:coagulation factor XI-like n=1 Tax=Ctenocephalides felis TaxID=7515 RepID=UPI000E6E1503|nr:coagulation factor XI-like [Ctenocephalides felis]
MQKRLRPYLQSSPTTASKSAFAVHYFRIKITVLCHSSHIFSTYTYKRVYTYLYQIYIWAPSNYICTSALKIQFESIIITNLNTIFRYPGVEPEQIFNVILGHYNPCQIDELTKRVFGIQKVYIHNKYITNGTFFDIALLKLDGDASMFTSICLPDIRGVSKPRAAEIVGYGATVEGALIEPCAMRTAIINLYTKRECRASDNPPYFWGPGILCAGIKSGYVDSCQTPHCVQAADRFYLCSVSYDNNVSYNMYYTPEGDSGGPLQVLVNGRYVLIGIVSFGIGCGRPGMPGVYTDVSKYLGWISTKINDSAEI